MTPQDCARFILSDCQDLALRAQADREHAEMLAEWMKDQEFKARWDANIHAFADEIDVRIAAEIFGDFYRA